MPQAGEVQRFEGHTGVVVTIHWGEDGGKHDIYFDFPDDKSEEWCADYVDTFTMCLIEQGVNPFAV